MYIEKDVQDLVEMAMDIAEQNNGEVPAEEMEALTQLAKEELLPRMDRMAGAVHFIDGDIDAISAEIKRLQERKKQMENAKETLKKRMLFVVERIGNQKTSLHTFSTRHTQALEVAENLDYANIPAEFVKTKVELDKLALKKHLIETGEVIAGVELKDNISLNLR